MSENEGRFDKVTKSVQAILAVLITLFTFLLFYALLFKGISDSSKDVILFILGSVSTILTQIISYYFGSSKDAADHRKYQQQTANDKGK